MNLNPSRKVAVSAVVQTGLALAALIVQTYFPQIPLPAPLAMAAQVFFSTLAAWLTNEPDPTKNAPP